MKTIRLTYTNGDSASARLGAELEEDTIRFFQVRTSRTEPIGSFPLQPLLKGGPFLIDGDTRIGFDIGRDQYVIHIGVGQIKTTYFADYEAMQSMLTPSPSEVGSAAAT